MNYLFFITLLNLLINYTVCADSVGYELKLLTVVLRHGDRAPDPGREAYPNDPHLNFTSEVPRGELTNLGKLREYNLGVQLRNFYGDFLGDIYNPHDVFSRSTEFRRAKMSLQLVLAGLYPPKNGQIWNPHLKWQPMIVNYVPGAYDTLLIPEECPQFVEELERVRNLPEIKKELATFEPLMKNLTIFTGKTINTSTDIYDLYNGLSAEKSMGLKLPSWTEDLFPQGPLLKGMLLEYKTVHYTDKLRRLNGGTILRHIVQNIKKIMNKEKTPRIHLLSGHETNIASILNTLNVFKPHVPKYASAVIVEFYERSGKFFVRIRYNHGIPADYETLTVPGCIEYCPVKKFLELMKNVIPTEDELICPKTGTVYIQTKPEY